MEKMIKAELQRGMDSCMRVMGVLRKTNVEAYRFEMEGTQLRIAVAPEKEHTALVNLQKLADVTVL